MKVLFVGLATLGAVVTAAAQEAQFVFAPTDGVEFKERVKSTVIQEVGAHRIETVNEGVTAVKITKLPGGFRLTATPISIKATRNGQEVESPVTKFMIGHTVVYEIAADGTLENISGFEELIEKMKQGMPAEMQRALLPLLNLETMMNREAAEYQGRYGTFVGKKVKVGDSWVSTDEFPLPTGPVKFNSITTFPAIKQDGDKLLVTVRFQYDTDSEAVKSLMNQAGKAIGDAVTTPVPKVEKATIKGAGERILDAKTMLIQSEQVKRVITAPVEMPDGTKQIQIRTETKEYSFEYPK